MTQLSTITLIGSGGTIYEVQARVVSSARRRTTLELRDGRLLEVPTAAIQANLTAAEEKVYRGVLKELDEGLAQWAPHQKGLSTGARSRQAQASLPDIVEWLILKIDSLPQGALTERRAKLAAAVSRVLACAQARFAEAEIADATKARKKYLSALQEVPKEPRRPNPSRLSTLLRRHLANLREAELADWKKFSERFTAHPHLEVKDQSTVNVETNGEFFLHLKVALDAATNVPAKNVRVVLDQHRGAEVVGQLPVVGTLSPGSSHPVRIRMIDRRRQGASDELRVRAHLTYVGPNNDTLQSAYQKLTLHLRAPAKFQKIPNPFREYASGVPVDDPRMFFGRDVLIQDIASHLTLRPVGRCYGLYGQKRSGKSSVTGQVRAAIDGRDALVCQLSMGTIDRSAITQSFVTEVLDQLRERLNERLSADTFSNLLTRWPEPREISASPLASFRKGVNACRALLRKDGVNETRVILVVDEFTYLYELMRRDHVAEADQNQLRDFMRQWKGWLEAKLFSALVIGQDTMPAFLKAFANEFSVMHTERLDYLTEEETALLADRPITKRDGSSRFAGYGLSTIHQYTGGHPYFTQILCDRVVTVANEQRRLDINEHDVEAAVATLLTGPREIGRHRFDCLLSADNTGVLLEETSVGKGLATSDTAFRVLQRLAVVAGQQDKPVDRGALELDRVESQVFDDLCERNVLSRNDDGLYKIRVLLFSEYVRRAARG